MLIALNIALLVLLIATALGACLLRNLLSAVIVFSIYSLTMAVMWQTLHAPDLAIAQAAVGGAITTAFFLIIVFKTKRRKN